MPCQPQGAVEHQSFRHAVFEGFAIRALDRARFSAKLAASVIPGLSQSFFSEAALRFNPFTTSCSIPIVFGH